MICVRACGTPSSNHIGRRLARPTLRPLHFATVSRPAPAARCAPAAAIDTLQQHRQLRRRRHRDAFLGACHTNRPRSNRLANKHSPSPSAKAAKNGSFPNTVCACTARLSKARTHIGRAHCQPDPRAPPASPSSQQLHHLPQCLRRNLAADAQPRTATELDLNKPCSFDPSARRSALRRRHDLDRHHRVALRLPGGAFGSISRRHLNSWFVFRSCRRATIETDEPGSSVSATTWRLNASGQFRRFPTRGVRLVSTNPLVDTSFAAARMRQSWRQLTPRGRRSSPSAYVWGRCPGR